MLKALVLVVLTISTAVDAFLPVAPIAPEIHHAPKPYSFGYTIKDKHGEHHREETGDGVGHVKGSYGFTDERGINRQVHYVADKAGFRAEVKTNEHGTAPLNPAAVKMISSAHPYLGGAGKGFLGLGKLPLGAGPLVGSALPIGAPPVAPVLAKEGLGLGYGGSLLGGAIEGYGGPLLGGAIERYGGPLLGGAIDGYDNRFGPY